MQNQSQDRNLKVRLFGALRKYGNGTELEIRVPLNCSIANLRERMRSHLLGLDQNFPDSALIEDCAFGTETEMLTETDVIKDLNWVAALPPVCGG